MPLTVCIPVYNPGHFLTSAVESVLAQESVDLELIVIDDASEHPISDQLAGIHDSRLQVERNPHNLGMVKNWNRCLDLARGDPILLFHQDDRMRQGFLAHAMEALNRHPEAGFAFSNASIIDADGNTLGTHWSPNALPDHDTAMRGCDLIRLLLEHGNLVPCQTVIVRAAVYAQAGHFNRELGYTPDLEMWFRLARRTGVVYLSQPWVEIRRHPGQESTRFISTAREVDEVRRAFQSYFSSASGLGDSDGISISEARTLARHHLRRWIIGNIRQSLRQRRWQQAVDFGMCFARFQVETLRGLPC